MRAINTLSTIAPPETGVLGLGEAKFTINNRALTIAAEGPAAAGELRGILAAGRPISRMLRDRKVIGEFRK
jgi:hypothetical protein